MPNQSLVLPDEVPDETLPLADGEFVPAPPFRGDMLREIDGKNVFVSLKSGKTLVGHLNCDTKFFSIGSSDEIYFYSDVDSFREV